MSLFRLHRELAAPRCRLRRGAQVGGGTVISIVSAKVAALTQGVMKTMMFTKLTIAAEMLTIGLLLGSAMVHQTWALDSPDQPRPGSSNAEESAAGVSADQFDKLRALIKPKPGGFDDLPWMTDLWAARNKAATEGKPLLVWVGVGHPLGWT